MRLSEIPIAPTRTAAYYLEVSEVISPPDTAVAVVTAPSRSACSILVDWANGQDHWARRIVRAVVESRQALPSEVVEEVYQAFLVEKGLADGEADEVPPLGAVDGEVETVEPFRVTSLVDVEGVNALAPKQEITFNDGLTILFGENACGKTGYVRVLKTVAAVRTSEPILGNVHDGTPRAQRAVLQYRLGAVDETYKWSGATAVAPFTRMNVFDSDAVAIHVDDDLSYAYTPRDLALFRYVTDAIDGVKTRLDAARDAAKPPSNPFVHRFERDTRAYSKIALLDSATDVVELRSLANVTKEEEERLPGLREQVEALRPESTQTQLRLAKSKAALLRSIEATAKQVVTFDAAAYEEEHAALRLADDAYRDSSERAFADEKIPGILGPEWRDFIDAGERYVEATHADPYPSEGSACVYCRQDLGDAAIRLIAKYRALSHDTTKQASRDARARLSTRQRTAAAIDISGLDAAVARDAALIEDAPALVAAATTFTEQAKAFAAAVAEGERLDFSVTKSAAEALSSEVAKRVKDVDVMVENLMAKAEERHRLHAEATKTLRELESRILLRQLLPDIEAYVQRAKWVVRAATAGAKLPPIHRTLTDATKDASETLLNTDFEELFREECTALRAPTVKLHFPGRKGEPARRKSIVPQHKLSEILSEGEQKVIALADFLAEARLRSTAATIVFDDPVNSLDYKRMREVVARIVRLSAQQQVIVFTHNIWFAVEMLAHFERADRDRCSYFDVSADGTQIGIVTKGTNPRWDTPKEIGKRINTLVQEAAQLTGEVQQALIEKGYDLIRSWCEAAVEQDVLCGVAQRYQPNIMMTKLPQIKADRLVAATAVIDPIFAKACRLMTGHSQPLETLAVRSTLAELKDDWKALQDAHAAYMK